MLQSSLGPRLSAENMAGREMIETLGSCFLYFTSLELTGNHITHLKFRKKHLTTCFFHLTETSKSSSIQCFNSSLMCQRPNLPSNQSILTFRCFKTKRQKIWSEAGSNPGPSVSKAPALPFTPRRPGNLRGSLFAFPIVTLKNLLKSLKA